MNDEEGQQERTSPNRGEQGALSNCLGLGKWLSFGLFLLNDLDPFSWEPALSPVSGPTFPPVRLELHAGINLGACRGIEFTHDGDDLVLLQLQLGR